MCMCVCMYSHPQVDRISDMFKTDFQKMKDSWSIFETLSFYTFSFLLKSFLGYFGPGSWGFFEKRKSQKK